VRTHWILAGPSAELTRSLPIGPSDSVNDLSKHHRPLQRSNAAHAEGVSGLAVVAGSIASLRAAVPVANAVGPIRELRLLVEGTRSALAVRVPNGPVGKTPSRSVRLTTEDHPTPYVRLEVRFRVPTPAQHAMAAYLARPQRLTGSPNLGVRVGINHAAQRSWGAGDSNSVLVDFDSLAAQAQEPPPVDVVVFGSKPSGQNGGPVPVLYTDHREWRDLLLAPRRKLELALRRSSGAHHIPPVDTDVLSPTGLWNANAQSGHATLSRDGVRTGEWVVRHVAGHEVARIPTAHGLSEVDVDKLRGLRSIHIKPTAFLGPTEQATFLAQAASAALPVVPAVLDAVTRNLLGPELAAEIQRGAHLELDDDIQFESWLVDMHRSAFAHARSRAVWRREARRMGFYVPPTPAVSVILATRRADRLSSILRQLERQSWPEIELVIGLHGLAADQPKVRQALHRLALAHTVRVHHESRCLGEVLQDLTSAASGTLIAKVDDDDWYGVHHITDLVNAMEYSGATLVGCGAEFVYLAELDVTIRRHSRQGHTHSRMLAGGTLMIRTDDLQHVHGWRPVPRRVDTALIDSTLAAGGITYRSHALGYLLYRAPSGHTWSEGPEYFLRSADTQWPGFTAPPGVTQPDDPPSSRQIQSWFDTRAATT
jgi:hypothetical protein